MLYLVNSLHVESGTLGPAGRSRRLCTRKVGLEARSVVFNEWSPRLLLALIVIITPFFAFSAKQMFSWYPRIKLGNTAVDLVGFQTEIAVVTLLALEQYGCAQIF